MAEGEKETQAPQPKKGSPIIKWLVLILAPILVAAISAMLVWSFLLKPMLSAEPPPPPNEDAIPMGTVTVDLGDAHTTILMPSTEYQASILQYQIELVCIDQPTADLVTGNKGQFVSLARKLHSYKTRDELQNPMVEESIRRQMLQESNQLLQRLLPVPNPAVKVIDVLHLNFFVVDP